MVVRRNEKINYKLPIEFVPRILKRLNAFEYHNVILPELKAALNAEKKLLDSMPIVVKYIQTQHEQQVFESVWIADETIYKNLLRNIERNKKRYPNIEIVTKLYAINRGIKKK